MATKTISIMDDVHNLLLSRKRINESFSDVIRRVFGQKKDIMEFAGIWKDIDDKTIGKMKKEIRELRLKSTKETLKNDIY